LRISGAALGAKGEGLAFDLRRGGGSKRRLKNTTLHRGSLVAKQREVDIDAVSKLRADYAGRIDWYPKNNPRGATAPAVYQTVVSELDARLARLTGQGWGPANHEEVSRVSRLRPGIAREPS
jgi:hypothetical protein